MELSRLGWDSHFENISKNIKDPNLTFARVSEQHRNKYALLGSSGELVGELSGKMLYKKASVQLPTVGDWVAIQVMPQENKGIIQHLLPRRSAIERKTAGELTTQQVLAANIDIMIIVTGLDHDYNLRRIERYLTMAYNSAITPVILLNKSDLIEDPDQKMIEVAAIAPGVPIHAISAARGDGFDSLAPLLIYGRTVVLLGSSGVGKSSIINRLTGNEDLAVAEVRANDSRGRHTTTYRQMILLPQGGIMIDTPGLREIQLWGDEEGLKPTFDDIEQIAVGCRFSDCGHDSEPGCAVRAAIDVGQLDIRRFESFLKLKRELKYLKMKQTMKSSAVEKSRWKSISKIQKKMFDDDR